MKIDRAAFPGCPAKQDYGQMPLGSHPLRIILDRIYLAGGIIGAGFLIAILCVIVIQMIARWSGHVFPGSTEYAGYCMAAASFFSLAYALNNGAHIRVSLFLNRLGSYRRWGELWCFGLAVFLSGYFCWYAWRAIQFSHMLNDISQGQDATPLWIPQIAMGIGTTLLFIAFVDNFLRLILFGSTNMTAEIIDDEER